MQTPRPRSPLGPCRSPITLPCSLASPHLPGPRHNSRNRASAVTARTAGRGEEAAMAAPGGQEGNARIAGLCAGGLTRRRAGCRWAGAACVPDGAGPAGRERCQRAAGQAASRSASESCSPAPRPRTLAVLAATPSTFGGRAQRGRREAAGLQLPREALMPSRREKAAGPGKVAPSPQPGSLTASVVLVTPR